ncbi:peroxide stress protein YaaA [Parvibium lacunae]|uniref:UPF0246 protein DU000_00825 n=1 Tax=Parvibium lacunae TaxID=1888893 RepID=A0A368L7V3_9BURK|nr:peroxide stress protein YaaA [Parvibium lacunae]RCS59319.1 peroxide stress protein YaaA [Parvibium lacunae]
MIFLLSPAKTLDFATPSTTKTFSEPSFLAHSAELITQLRGLSPQAVAKLMSVSDSIAALNVARFAEWQPPFTEQNAKQAVLAFAGDVYEGLAAPTLNQKQLQYLQKHLRILSGLYGYLRPLDLMQAYRLEMGTKLANVRGKDLYAFWGDVLTQALNAENKKQTPIINLASEEYFKVMQPKQGIGLNALVITPVFEDWKNGQYKIISFYAKRARGLMVRYAALNGLTDPAQLKGFDLEGYAFAPDVSSDASWVFRRQES